MTQKHQNPCLLSFWRKIEKGSQLLGKNIMLKHWSLNQAVYYLHQLTASVDFSQFTQMTWCLMMFDDNVIFAINDSHTRLSSDHHHEQWTAIINEHLSSVSTLDWCLELFCAYQSFFFTNNYQSSSSKCGSCDVSMSWEKYTKQTRLHQKSK